MIAMTDSLDLRTCNIQAFYRILRSLGGIAPIHGRIHKLLCEMEPGLSLPAQKVLYIYFSLLEDGNTRLALNTDEACHKWLTKYRSLLNLYSTEQPDCLIDFQNAENDFSDILASGIHDILTQNYKIFEDREPDAQTPKDKTTKPFVRVTDEKKQIKYLYATRYFDAKCIIEQRAKTLFPTHETQITESDIHTCEQTFTQDLKDVFQFEKCQLEAILRGQNENLIITGGPGTGKTTVITFLLWKLLKAHPDMLTWEIKLAAPSGKAADRMRESLLKTLQKFKPTPKTQPIYDKLYNLESYTLHRLLSYNPVKNKFNYNEDTPFPQNDIFVIDEASMIDIDLFARFMEALPKAQNTYRLFILGDPDQLPSVEAGAVLGEMLETSHCAAKLTESQRFKSTSKIGKLSIAIQNAKIQNHWPEDHEKPLYLPSEGNIPNFDSTTSDNIYYLTLNEDNTRANRELSALIQRWTDTFYIQNNNFIKEVRQIYISHDQNTIVNAQGHPVTAAKLDKIWKVTEHARILSAERKGTTGVENLNALVRKHLGISSSDPFFVGQLLMLTENQATLKLYNGDCGIVLGEKDSGRLYLLLKKSKTTKTENTAHTDDYVVYPLSMLPQNALESAFAITIHKSQGSGYANIMMFLPRKKGHPLLNNQMIYTGVTRTEEKSLTIVTTQEAFEAGCQTVIERDTGIDISI